MNLGEPHRCVIHAWSMRDPCVNPLCWAWTPFFWREPRVNHTDPNFPLCTWYYAKHILATLRHSSANSQASEHLYHGPTRDRCCRAVSTYVPSVLVVKESNVLARPAVHKGFLSKKSGEISICSRRKGHQGATLYIPTALDKLHDNILIRHGGSSWNLEASYQQHGNT